MTTRLLAKGSAGIVRGCPDTEGAYQDPLGRVPAGTQEPVDDVGVGQSSTTQCAKSSGQNVREVADTFRAGASPPHLRGTLRMLGTLAEVVPDVAVARNRNPPVPVSLQMGLDADDIEYLVVHHPSEALGGLRESAPPLKDGRVHGCAATTLTGAT